MLGRVWTAIEKSSLASETAMVVVSDHGFNTNEEVYSQGYNIVKLLGSAAGGGHHVITKRRLLLDYAIKGINPFVPLVTTTTRESFYLNKQSTDYPTAVLDFDGNERAAIHLRDSDLNLLHILLQQLQRKDLTDGLQRALTDLFFQTIEARRQGWQAELDDLNEELRALSRSIDKQRAVWSEQPKKFSPEEMAVGRDDEARRIYAQLNRWVQLEKKYSDYATRLSNLLALRQNDFNPRHVKIEDVLSKRSMGNSNSIYQLQNYVAGIAPGGLILNPDGSLDLERSFVRINYFTLLNGVTVRNNVQPQVRNRPVDMIATRIPADRVLPLLLSEQQIDRDVIWVYGGPDKQALILSREDSSGRLNFRYLPVRNLRQHADGQIHFERASWGPDFPLRLYEDRKLAVPEQERESWLSQWHTELEWLRAIHRTEYSNGLIGLHEVLARHRYESISLDEPELTVDERLMRRLTKRQRRLTETDLLIVANNHWNFDVRGFNPGGNHGSFFRISTQSLLMFAGGKNTGIPHGNLIQEPYDSLSFVPTVLALTGKLRDDRSPIPVLWEKGFRSFPGRVISEVLPIPERRDIAVTGAGSSH